AVEGLKVPLAERLRRRGLARAAEHDRTRWRSEFGRIVEQVLHEPAFPRRMDVEIHPRTEERSVSLGQESVFIPVRVTNHGTHPLVREGAGRTVLHCHVVDETGGVVAHDAAGSPLPGLVLPGQAVTASVAVPVPSVAGSFRAVFWTALTGDDKPVLAAETEPSRTLRLRVAEGREGDRGTCSPVLAEVQTALAEAARRQQLPEGYTDVTSGRFAAFKRWVKQKLLNNFKRAYVDVLSRQQSAFNRQTLAALQ